MSNRLTQNSWKHKHHNPNKQKSKSLNKACCQNRKGDCVKELHYQYLYICTNSLDKRSANEKQPTSAHPSCLLLTRDVNETGESRVSIFFLDPGKAISRQRRRTGGPSDSSASHPAADRPLHFPSRAPPVAPSPGCFATFWAHQRPLCRSVDGVPALARNSVRDQPSGTSLRIHTGDPTPITPVKSMYSDEINSLNRDPGIATLDPGMRFPGN